MYMYNRVKSKKPVETRQSQRKKTNYGGHGYSSDSEEEERFTHLKPAEPDATSDRFCEASTSSMCCPLTKKTASSYSGGRGAYQSDLTTLSSTLDPIYFSCHMKI